MKKGMIVLLLLVLSGCRAKLMETGSYSYCKVVQIISVQNNDGGYTENEIESKFYDVYVYEDKEAFGEYYIYFVWEDEDGIEHEETFSTESIEIVCS